MIQLFFTKENIVAPRRLASFSERKNFARVVYCAGPARSRWLENSPVPPVSPRGVDFYDPGVIRVLRLVTKAAEPKQKETERNNKAVQRTSRREAGIAAPFKAFSNPLFFAPKPGPLPGRPTPRLSGC